jgi:predicted SAM-dependent methyltransferase
MTYSGRADTLSITLAAVDGLRCDTTTLREQVGQQADTLSITLAAVDGLRCDTTTLREQVGQQADTLSITLAAIRAEITNIEARLRDRIEFARAETMFELRAKMPGGIMPTVPGAATAMPVEPRILAPEKVAMLEVAGGLRINLGCGHVPLPGYLNADMRALPGVDIVAEAARLPFEPGSVTEIYSAHLLEHFPVEHLRRVVLPHWRLLLRQGGQLRAVVPDAEAMLADFAADEMSFDDLREVTFGLQEYDGDYHFNMFSRDHLSGLMREAGFIDVAFAFQGRRNGKCRDMEIRGVKAWA